MIAAHCTSFKSCANGHYLISQGNNFHCFSDDKQTKFAKNFSYSSDVTIGRRR